MFLWTPLCILVASQVIGLVVSYNRICYPSPCVPSCFLKTPYGKNTSFHIQVVSLRGPLCIRNSPNNPCKMEGYICLNVNPLNGYGMCRHESEVCNRNKGSECRGGKKCLSINDTLGINICIAEDMFCTGSESDSEINLIPKCMITDKARNEGIRVADPCSMLMDAPDNIDCPKGYRCCFNNGYLGGVCMKGDHKDFIPQC